MAVTAPEALEDKSSFSSLFLFSLLSALIDVKEADQRLLNGGTQEDGEIDRKGGEWRQRRYGGVGLKLKQIEKFLALLPVTQLHEMTL